MAKVRIVGVEQLQKKLRANATLDDVRRIVRKNGADMQARAQRNSPVDTGTLKRSIGLEITDGGLTAEMAPTAEYAPYVEYGTRFMDAQPFVKPAHDVQKGQFKRDMDRLTK